MKTNARLNFNDTLLGIEDNNLEQILLIWQNTQHVQILIRKLITNTSVNSIIFTSCAMDDLVKEDLENLLKTNQTLKSFQLNGCIVSNQTIKTILELAAVNNSLTKLYISNQLGKTLYINGTEIQTLIKMFIVNKTLKDFSLLNTNIYEHKI